MHLLLSVGVAAAAANFTVSSVFRAGESGYAAFRIPGIVAAGEVLVAVAEGRKYGCDDFAGQHDIVSKRSTDGGLSWSPLSIVADPVRDLGCVDGAAPGSGRCQFWDPTPAFDAQGGSIVLLAAYASSGDHSARLEGRQDIFCWRSSDKGLTWDGCLGGGRVFNISGQFGPPPRRSPANGHGVQLASGRLVWPAYGGAASHGGENSAAILSDDHGISFREGTPIPYGAGLCEGELAEATSPQTGQRFVVYNLRVENGSMPACGPAGHCRASSFSFDGGTTWSAPRAEPSLPDPACKGGLAASASGDLWFANDASATARINVTLRRSADAGASWGQDLQLWHGAAGYVDLAVLEPQAGGASSVVVAFENATCSIVAAVVSSQ